MKLVHTTEVPHGHKELLQLVILDEDHLDHARDFLDAHYQIEIELTEDLTGKGKQKLYHTDKDNLLFVGIGQPKYEHEAVRRAVATAVNHANEFQFKHLFIAFPQPQRSESNQIVTAIAEAASLTNYQFLTYKSDPKLNSLEQVEIYSQHAGDGAFIERGGRIANATRVARDLVNEPVITLTAEEMARRCEKLGQEYGFSVEVFNKTKIKSLKMGGILAVNAGSIDPPTFTIMEWKPENATNSQPVVLVGKGVVFDTGGLSLKPTPNSMDFMKADMGGAAAVIGAMVGVASLELPIHVVGLVPATDNRPGQKAYTPGDVIKMFDGSTVEVLNTDAEGRMLLADALAYAKKFDPGLCIDLATLTGAAVIAVGDHGSPYMGTASKAQMGALASAGERVYERLVEFPLWEEYREQLKSDIADLKNIGGRAAGSITAGKFLEHFTDYPWIHIDIAGPAYLSSSDAYRPKNGTGTGVRLLLEFLSNY